jgi:hypothetical protein
LISQGFADHGCGVVILARGQIGSDVGKQVGLITITGFREVNPIAKPME